MDYIYYYKYMDEVFGAVEEYDKRIKVQSLLNEKTYDIEKDWIVEQHQDNNLEFSKEGKLDF